MGFWGFGVQIQESDLILFEKFQEQRIEERAEFPPSAKES